MNCFQESVHIVQENMANITHFCHVNLEKIIYK